MVEVKQEDSTQYPSVGLAYEYVKSSYDVMLSRFEAANARIQNLFTWAFGLTAAIPAITEIVAGKEKDIQSLWILPMAIAFLALVVVGIIGYRSGAVKVLHPKTLYENYIKYPELEYKKWIIYWAGEHCETNQKYIDLKSRYIDIMTILLGLEVVCALLWIIMS